MDDLNAMLGKILDDPQSMEQLKAAAKALGLNPDGPPPPGFGGQEAPAQSQSDGSPPAGQQSPMPDLSALAGLFGAQNQQQSQPPPIDPAALKLIQGAVTKLNQPDKNIELLRALKPHFSPARSARVDNAIRLLQLFSLLPVLKESGILGDLGKLGPLGDLLNGGRRR